MARRGETGTGIEQRTKVLKDAWVDSAGNVTDQAGNVVISAAAQALVSEAGNITAAELLTTTGTLGQTVRLSDGPDRGAILMWSTPEGSTTPTWCWWLWPQAAY